MRLIRNIAIVLMLILSNLSVSHAGNSGWPSMKSSDAPEGYVSLDKVEQKNLASHIKQCELDKKNLASTERALNICTGTESIEPLWWQTNPGVVSISFASLLIGYFVGAK